MSAFEKTAFDCPACGQDFPSEMIGTIQINEENSVSLVNGIPLLLTPQEVQLLNALKDRMPNLATKHYLYNSLYGTLPEGEQAAEKIIDVFICKIRSKTEGMGLNIETVWGRGYQMSVKTISAAERSIVLEQQKQEAEQRISIGENPHVNKAVNAASGREKAKVNAVLEYSEDVGTYPELKWLDCKDPQIIIDDNYQRSVNMPHVQRLLANFNWNSFQPITLAVLPDGRFTVLDGQHRLEAAKLHPSVTKIPAYVVDLPELQDQAQAFVISNTNRLGVNVVNIYWASLTAGKPEYVEMQTLLDSLNLEISPEMGTLGDNMINAVKTLFAIKNQLGEKHLVFALEAIKDAFPRGRRKRAFQSTHMKALAQFNVYYPSADRDLLINMLSYEDEETMSAFSRELKLDFPGNATFKLLCEYLRRKYNEKTTKEDQLPIKIKTKKQQVS